MSNVELMAKISVNAGVVVNLARDNIQAMLRNGDRLTLEQFSLFGGESSVRPAGLETCATPE